MFIQALQPRIVWSLIHRPFVFTIHQSIINSQTSLVCHIICRKKIVKLFLGTQSDFLGLIIDSNQELKSQRCYIYCQQGQRKAANPVFQKAWTNFALNKTEIIFQLSQKSIESVGWTKRLSVAAVVYYTNPSFSFGVDSFIHSVSWFGLGLIELLYLALWAFFTRWPYDLIWLMVVNLSHFCFIISKVIFEYCFVIIFMNNAGNVSGDSLCLLVDPWDHMKRMCAVKSIYRSVTLTDLSGTWCIKIALMAQEEQLDTWEHCPDSWIHLNIEVCSWGKDM